MLYEAHISLAWKRTAHMDDLHHTINNIREKRDYFGKPLINPAIYA